MSTIFLLMLSNVFMTFAWYGHLRYGHDWPLWKAILVSWAIALFEYCLAVPANRLGFVQYSGFQLKIIQEAITISVFIVFAIFFLKEKLAWNYLVAFAFLGVAAFFAFAFKAPGSVICIGGRLSGNPAGRKAEQPPTGKPLAQLLQQKHAYRKGNYDPPDLSSNGRGSEKRVSPRGIGDQQKDGNFRYHSDDNQRIATEPG